MRPLDGHTRITHMIRRYTRPILWLAFACIALPAFTQSPEGTIKKIDLEIAAYRAKIDSLTALNAGYKREAIIKNLAAMGYPSGDEAIEHKALVLAYDEDHEMAKWVAHMVITDVINGRTSRTDDFRTDPMIKTGSSEELDYFIKSKTPEGDFTFDGFGYDRGHLAPSADFRWDEEALSESYFYSNMTPQHPDFNRLAWAEVEQYVRDYVIKNEVDLYVVTGPVLHPGLPKQERSKNSISIPEKHFKVVMDLDNQRGVAFLMDNSKATKPVENYMVPIDEIERLTGYDFFPALDHQQEKSIESATDYRDWLPEKLSGDAPLLKPNQLAAGQYNTLKAYEFADSRKKVTICGTVVSTHRSSKDNVFLNLDKRFPNNVFSVNIWKSDLINFSYPPEIALDHKTICVTGEVTLREGVPNMNVKSEKSITIIDAL